MALGVRFQRHRPGSPGSWGTQPKILHSPWDSCNPGGPRTARRFFPLGGPKLCRSVVPAWEHPGPYGLRAEVVSVGADSRAGEVSSTTVAIPSSRGPRG